MKNIIIILLFSISINSFSQEKYIDKKGTLSFFSHTLIEDIKAVNNHSLCIIDTNSNEIAITALMKLFEFKKSLMKEHFNENYIESDIYPKTKFVGVIKNETDYNNKISIEGDLTIHGITKKVNVKATLVKKENDFILQGKFPVKINDYKIRIPNVVRKNIAEIVEVNFNFKLTKYTK